MRVIIAFSRPSAIKNTSVRIAPTVVCCHVCRVDELAAVQLEYLRVVQQKSSKRRVETSEETVLLKVVAEHLVVECDLSFVQEHPLQVQFLQLSELAVFVQHSFDVVEDLRHQFEREFLVSHNFCEHLMLLTSDQ